MKKVTPVTVLVLSAALVIAAAVEAQQGRSSGRTGSASFGSPSLVNRTATFRTARSHSGRAGNIDEVGRHRRQNLLHPRTAVVVGGGREAVELQVVVEQTQPVEGVSYRDPTATRVYVQPRWVDGGHGVEVLQPGYWAEPR